jgi:hypothetical protein
LYRSHTIYALLSMSKSTSTNYFFAFPVESHPFISYTWG